MSLDNDVTENRSAGEGKGSRAARAAFDPPPGFADTIGDAVARASDRQREMKLAPAPLGAEVRALVRCGLKSDGVTPTTMRFDPSQTADGKEHVVEHGRPVRLKRAAFEILSRDGTVIRGE